MNNIIYLDNAATTKPYDDILNIAEDLIKENYFNPSAVYDVSVELSKRIEKVRSLMMRSINATEGKVIFTSCGTESTNMALSSIKGNKKNVITTEYEHSATIKLLEKLEEKGFEIIKVKPKKERVEIEDIIDIINNDTALVTVMNVNNETGHIIDVEKLGKLIKSKNRNTLFHVDAVQSFMKLPIDVDKSNIDFLSISSHKIHGLKGSGALYVRNINKISPLILGGGQEMGFRSGTDNTLGVLSLGKAVEIGMKNFDENYLKIKVLKEKFIDSISSVDDVVVNSNEYCANHIVNVSFLGVPAEVLLHSLESKKIYVSSGSACSSKKKSSRVLESFSLSDEVKKSAIRVSFSHMNTMDEIDCAIKEIKKSVDEIREITKYRKRG